MMVIGLLLSLMLPFNRTCAHMSWRTTREFAYWEEFFGELLCNALVSASISKQGQRTDYRVELAVVGRIWLQPAEHRDPRTSRWESGSIAHSRRGADRLNR